MNNKATRISIESRKKSQTYLLVIENEGISIEAMTALIV